MTQIQTSPAVPTASMEHTYQAEYLHYIISDVRKERILCLDPGETLGWAFFVDGHVLRCGQYPIHRRLAAGESFCLLLNSFIDDLVCATDESAQLIDVCVTEDYVVYAHKLQANVWSSLFTVRLIGAFQLLCSERRIPVTYQMAAEAKFFGSDDKLRRWGLYQTKLKHANDAIRHGVYYMLRKSSLTRRK